MRVIRDIFEMQTEVLQLKKQGKSIGIVPTMGALHDGHLSLVKEAREQNDIVIATIFVNPIQFGPNEDLDSYPRTFDADSEKLENAGTDYLFFPKDSEIYPEGYNTYVNVNSAFTEKLCGGKRPGHFQGVTTIVNMLFNICQPDRGYFGLKDYQQVLVIQKMVNDMRIPVEIVPVPIYREEDGLAMSSRNKYLSPEERQDATLLYQSLKLAEKAIKTGKVKDAAELKKLIEAKLSESSFAKIDYIEITNPQSLQPVAEINGSVLIALAVFMTKARLIDNILIK